MLFTDLTLHYNFLFDTLNTSLIDKIYPENATVQMNESASHIEQVIFSL